MIAELKINIAPETTAEGKATVSVIAKDTKGVIVFEHSADALQKNAYAVLQELITQLQLDLGL